MYLIRYLIAILAIVVQAFAHGPYSITAISSTRSPEVFEIRQYLQDAFRITYHLRPFATKTFRFVGLSTNAKVRFIRGLTYTTDPYPQLYAVCFEWSLTSKVVQSSLWLIDWRLGETHFLSSTHQRIEALDFTHQSNHYELEWVTKGMQVFCPYLHHRLSLQTEIEHQMRGKSLRSSYDDNDHQIDHSRTICLTVPHKSYLRQQDRSTAVTLREKFVAAFDIQPNNTVIVRVWPLMRRDKHGEHMSYTTQLHIPNICKNAKLRPVLIDQPNVYMQDRVTLALKCEYTHHRFYYVYFELRDSQHTLNRVVDENMYEMKGQQVNSFLIDRHMRLALHDTNLYISSSSLKGVSLVHLIDLPSGQHTVFDAIHYSGSHFPHIPLVNLVGTKGKKGNNKITYL